MGAWSRNLCEDGDRVCKVCNAKKPQSEYHKSYSVCKACQSLKRRQEYWGDLETSRLEARIRWHSEKSKLRRLRKWLSTMS